MTSERELRNFGADVQHILPNSVFATFATQLARLQISTNESTANKVLLLNSQHLLDKFKDTAALADVLTGLDLIGGNRHDYRAGEGEGGNHPGYNKFAKDQLTQIFRATMTIDPVSGAEVTSSDIPQVACRLTSRSPDCAS